MKKVVSDKAYASNSREIGDSNVNEYIQKVSMKISNNSTSETTPVYTSTTKPQIEINKEKQPIYTASNSNPILEQNNNNNKIKQPIYTASNNNIPDKPSISPFRTLFAEQSSAIPKPQNNQIFDTKNMESILTNQLNTLTQIASILTSINDKVDLNKLAEMNTKNNKSTSPLPPIDKGISKNSVNLSRKTVLM